MLKTEGNSVWEATSWIEVISKGAKKNNPTFDKN